MSVSMVILGKNKSLGRPKHFKFSFDLSEDPNVQVREVYKLSTAIGGTQIWFGYRDLPLKI